MKQLNVCVVGGGAMGRTHARIWQQMAETQVVSLVDADRTLAASVSAELGIPTHYTDYREAVAQPDVDLVSVCVPTFLHPEITRLAAKHGKHILCEKPIALTLADAQSMIDAADAAGVKLAIGLMRRYSPLMQALRDFLSGDRQPVIYRAESTLPIRPKRAMHDQHKNGGPYIDMLCHFIDTWRVIFDSEPVRVMAHGLTLGEQRSEIEHIAHKAIDSGSFSVEFASGDVGCGFITWGLPPGSNHAFPIIENLYGAHGVLDVRFIRDQEIMWHKEGGASEVLISAEPKNYEWQLAAFARAILHDEPIQSTGADGLAALRVSLALLESIKTGQAVEW